VDAAQRQAVANAARAEKNLDRTRSKLCKFICGTICVVLLVIVVIVIIAAVVGSSGGSGLAGKKTIRTLETPDFVHDVTYYVKDDYLYLDVWAGFNDPDPDDESLKELAVDYANAFYETYYGVFGIALTNVQAAKNRKTTDSFFDGYRYTSGEWSQASVE